MNRAPRWRPAPGVVWQRGADATFALDTEQRDPRPLRIEGGGELIWQRLVESPASAEELVAAIAEQTGEPAAVIAPAVEKYLEKLRSAALVVAGDA